MERFLFFVIASVLLAGTIEGAPWVFLDSRSDMLAMSSEVSESVVAPSTESHRKSSSEDTSREMSQIKIASSEYEKNEDEASAKETVQYVENDASALTETKSGEGTLTTATSLAHEKEEVESTTTTVGALVESGLKQEDMNIQVVPEPLPVPEQNPNSIEDDSLESVIVVISNKRKHAGKPQKYF